MEFEDNKVNRFYRRTLEHIQRVQKNMLFLVTYCQKRLGLTDQDCLTLMRYVLEHDLSKLSPEQFGPYVELTEFFYQRKNLKNASYDYDDPEMKAKVEAAIEAHYKAENHHPEKMDPEKKDRWDLFASIECACDLQAMAQEFGEASAMKYFKDVWEKKQRDRFSSDFDWKMGTGWIKECIRCFDDYGKDVAI